MTSHRQDPRPLLRDPGHLLAFGLGSGLSPFAPGTAGTAAAMPIYFLAAQLPLPYYWLVTVAVIAIGTWLCGRAAHALGVHDHGAIVIDEWAGYLVTMAALPVTWYWALAGFFVFRFFDIVKPWPARWIDRRVPGGIGIMFDDVAAGFYGLALLQALAWLFGGGGG